MYVLSLDAPVVILLPAEVPIKTFWLEVVVLAPAYSPTAVFPSPVEIDPSAPVPVAKFNFCAFTWKALNVNNAMTPALNFIFLRYFNLWTIPSWIYR